MQQHTEMLEHLRTAFPLLDPGKLSAAPSTVRREFDEIKARNFGLRYRVARLGMKMVNRVLQVPDDLT